MHFYDMTPERDAWDTALYPRAKFVSEFGFQSFASFPVFANQSAPGDWSRNSSMVGFRRAAPAAHGKQSHSLQHCPFVLHTAKLSRDDYTSRCLFEVSCPAKVSLATACK